MKKLLLTFCLLLTPTIAHADLEARNGVESPYIADVPRQHWSYPVLVEIFLVPSLSKYHPVASRHDPKNGWMIRNFSVTRYEVAVAIARMTDPKNDVIDNPRAAGLSAWDATPKSLEFIDMMAALEIEFAPEIARLGVRPGAIEYSN